MKTDIYDMTDSSYTKEKTSLFNYILSRMPNIPNATPQQHTRTLVLTLEQLKSEGILDYTCNDDGIVFKVLNESVLQTVHVH